MRHGITERFQLTIGRFQRQGAVVHTLLQRGIELANFLLCPLPPLLGCQIVERERKVVREVQQQMGDLAIEETALFRIGDEHAHHLT